MTAHEHVITLARTLDIQVAHLDCWVTIRAPKGCHFSGNGQHKLTWSQNANPFSLWRKILDVLVYGVEECERGCSYWDDESEGAQK